MLVFDKAILSAHGALTLVSINQTLMTGAGIYIMKYFVFKSFIMQWLLL